MPFNNKYTSEHASSTLESFVSQKHERSCKELADKCQNLLSDTWCICHFVKQLTGQAIYLLWHVCEMEYKVSAEPKLEAAMALKIERLNYWFSF